SLTEEDSETAGPRKPSHGRMGNHQKQPGDQGNASGSHHHRINFDKYHLHHFGKV
ncbi:60s ribosomal protein l27a-like, partial [Lynx pardinus]